MRIGLALPQYDFSLPGVDRIRFDAVAEVAVRAERLGFESLWLSDHFFSTLERYGGGSTRYGALEPLATLASLAPLTERVRLGTLVLSAGFRHPAILAKFKEDPKSHLLLMSYGTGAVGLNLQFAGYVFLFDRWWNPAVEDQAINRAHRIGQKTQVIVTKFISKDTIEEKIDKVLNARRVEAEMVMEFDNIETIKRAIEIDAGIGLLPEPTVTREVAAGSLVAIPLSGRPLTRPLRPRNPAPGSFSGADLAPSGTAKQPAVPGFDGPATQNRYPITSSK